MTEEGKFEEKAREKARAYNTEYAEDCEFRDMISRPKDFIDGAIERMYLLLKEKHYRDGYLDGLKAGRPEWHKVADGNLPKDNRLVLIQVVNGNSTMGIYYVNAWREICNCKELTGVIAWCEIPKYTEE